MRVKELTNEINLQKWSQIIEECRNSKKQVTQWCKEKGVKKRKTVAVNIPTFAEVKMSVNDDSNDIALTLSINNTSIQVHNYADEEPVAAVLRMIKAL